ncbi:MAG: thiamine phosphate synthase [Lachnospiraceae bacterium]|nr:thiamine phosphate synthase [Lachnospiraceae bacterium]
MSYKGADEAGSNRIQRLCREYNIPFIVNDYVELAKDIG